MTEGTLEIEHKFIVDEAFDSESFFRSVRRLNPTSEFTSEVRDTYFFNPKDTAYVLRHRIDKKIQQLTLKTLNRGDTAVRTEINLNLGPQNENQIDLVTHFCAQIGATHKCHLVKNIRVFEFQDAEIVFYVAEGPKKQLRCVEFEALERSEINQGLTIISKYERLLGFDAGTREHHSLFELLILPATKE